MLAAKHSSIGACILAGLFATTAAAGGPGSAPDLTVEQIVERNVAARGGLEAWLKVQTMVWTGTIETGNPGAPTAQFVYEWKRPNKTRFEVTVAQEKRTQVFNGTVGWTVRASNAGIEALRRYTYAQARSARDAQAIEGLLIDHQARGIEVALEGADQVEGHRTYRLAVTLPSGAKRRVWVDAHTFLELKSEHASTDSRHGRAAPVYYRGYQLVDGLQVPRTLETQAHGVTPSETTTIEDVTLNLSLSDAHFDRPDVSRRDRTRLIWARNDRP